ncbi:MAG: cytochrome c [Steroidobacteraceae bacterium]|jgi:cbb3-type cytochrome c oxidase subunit III
MSPEDITPQASRENPEPEEAGNPVPRWLLGLVGLLALGSAYYILRVNASTDTGYGDQRTVSDLLAQPKQAAGGATAVDGAAIFSARCAACHQATGAGLPGVFPPLAGSNWVNGHDTTVIQIVLHGVQGSLTVNGGKYNGTMPTFGAQLSDADIAAVLSYVRNHWGNKAGDVSAQLVTAQRAATAQHNEPWQGDADLSKLP